jgi:hypothetical protein
MTMEGHEERAKELEYELAEMQERSDGLGDDIETAKGDWEQKKQDGSVPGAGTGDEPEAEAEPAADED